MGKQYTCSYCGKILYSSQYVKKHEATHTGQKFKAATCKYCGKTVEYTKVNLQFSFDLLKYCVFARGLYRGAKY